MHIRHVQSSGHGMFFTYTGDEIFSEYPIVYNAILLYILDSC